MVMIQQKLYLYFVRSLLLVFYEFIHCISLESIQSGFFFHFLLLQVHLPSPHFNQLPHINLHRNNQQLMFTDSLNQLSVIPGGLRSPSGSAVCVLQPKKKRKKSWENRAERVDRSSAITSQSKCDLFPQK